MDCWIWTWRSAWRRSRNTCRSAGTCASYLIWLVSWHLLFHCTELTFSQRSEFFCSHLPLGFPHVFPRTGSKSKEEIQEVLSLCLLITVTKRVSRDFYKLLHYVHQCQRSRCKNSTWWVCCCSSSFSMALYRGFKDFISLDKGESSPGCIFLFSYSYKAQMKGQWMHMSGSSDKNTCSSLVNNAAELLVLYIVPFVDVYLSQASNLTFRHSSRRLENTRYICWIRNCFISH